ncbi:MAG: phosphate ABC transporter permease PstA [Sedimentisphaerales bacterium]|jgi:phosphate transport system permease protein
MKPGIRIAIDKIFTVVAGTSVVCLCLVLAVVLGPMLWRGGSAVAFKGTVEFRKMQLVLFGRGDEDKIEAESRQAEIARAKIYSTIEKFKGGIDSGNLIDKARQIYRQFGNDLQQTNLSAEDVAELRSVTRKIRDRLESAFASSNMAEVNESLAYVLNFKDDPRFKNNSAAGLIGLAKQYSKDIHGINLAERQRYYQELRQVEDILTELLGPAPGTATHALMMNRFGATRWDLAQKLLGRLLWYEEWIKQGPGQPMVRRLTPRSQRFAGTEIEGLFAYIQQNLPEMLKPRPTFYWQYFIDDSTPGHYFGGVGPEILGTLLLTVLAMLFVVPFGVISAAYLVECASDNFAMRIIRMSINTLAGVPSIVFGLFGLAFFVMFFLPMFGAPSKGCILAASMTLAVLTLPVMIRASEEAIRAVPQTYKEASLALGASRFRTFVKVTLPAALPGILTGVILSLSRVAGETAPVLFTGVVALGPVPKSIFDPTRTLSYGSYDMAVGDKLAAMVPHNQFGMVVTLVLLILCLNTVAIILRSRVFKKLAGH